MCRYRSVIHISLIFLNNGGFFQVFQEERKAFSFLLIQVVADIFPVINIQVIYRIRVFCNHLVEVLHTQGIGFVELLPEAFRKIFVGYPSGKNERQAGKGFPMLCKVIDVFKMPELFQGAVTDNNGSCSAT